MASGVFVRSGDGLVTFGETLAMAELAHNIAWGHHTKANREGPSGTLRTPEVHVGDLHGRHSLDYKGKVYDRLKALGRSPEEILLRSVGAESPPRKSWGILTSLENRSAKEIWEAALGELRLQVTGATYRDWLEKTTGLSYEDNRFVVGVPNHFVAEYLARDQRSLIEKTLIGLTHPGVEVHFRQNTCRVTSKQETTAATTDESSRPHPTQEVVDKFLAAKKGKLRPDSITSYSAVLRPFARDYPELPLEPEPIEAYLDNFSHENTTAQFKFSVLRTFYRWLSRRNLIAVNPTKMMEPPGGQADEVLPLNEEQARLLNDMPKTDREQGYIGLMLDHGFRLSEVIRLDVGDIHEDRIWIHGKERREWFPLLSEVRGWLLKLADGRGPGEPLFAGRQGRLSDSQVQSDIKRLLQRAGINDIRQSPHTLRHSFSTLAYLAGCDWDAVELLLRQKERKRNVTNRYIHLSPEQRLRLMGEKLEGYSPLRIVAKAELGKKPDYAQLTKAPSPLFALDTNIIQSISQEILPQLLDQCIALGEAAKDLKRQLGGNGHHKEQLRAIEEYLKCQAGR